MSDPITAAITGAVAAAKEASGDPEADLAAGDIPGEADTSDDTVVSLSETSIDDEPAPSLDQVGKVLATKPVEELDEFAKEHGIRSKEASGRENRIPYSRVKAISENAVKKATAPLVQERDTYRAHNADYVARLERIAVTENVMMNNPTQFVQILRTLPGYEEVFAALGGGGGGRAVAAASDDPMPDADGRDASGNPAYTPEGFRKVLEWNRRQGARDAEAQLARRYEPMEKAFQTHQEMGKRGRQQSDAINAHIAEASNWRHFKDHEDEILEALRADTSQAQKSGRFKYGDLRAAYEDVVFAKLTTDRQKVREALMAELKVAPTSTAVGRSVTAPTATASTSNDPIGDAIRNSLARARGQRA